ITAATRILVNARYAKEDRLTAESLAEEIEAATRHRPRITTAAASASTANTIVLTRLTDAASKRKLKAQGLAADPNFNEEGYLLTASATGVIVAGQSGAGLFYGVQTLRQLIQPEQCGPAASAISSSTQPAPSSATPAATSNDQPTRIIVPAVAIKDWPTVRWRGVHDDVSRGPIPTVEYMKKQIRTLAEYKINLFSIYMENVFDYKDQPLIAPKEAAITPAQIEELVAYAKKYFVTILPEQQASGHLHHVLKYEIYNDLAETPHGHVLAP